MKRLKIALVYNTFFETASYNIQDIEDMNDLKKSISRLARHLRKLGHNVVIMPLGNDLFGFQRKLYKLQPDLIFNQYEDVVHGAIYEMRLAAMVQMMGFQITGSPAIALGLCRYKYMCTLMLQGAGIPVPPQTQLVEMLSDIDIHKWTFPLIVQPALEHGGVGLERESVVHTKKALQEKVRQVRNTYKQPVLVQQFLFGREFNVSVIGGSKMRILPLSEVCYEKLPPDIPKIMSYAAKWVETSTEYKKIYIKCPADVEPDLLNRIEETALKAFRTIGGWGYGRVDMRLDDNNIPCVLEINCNPYLEGGVGIARSAERAGMSYPEFLELIIKFAFEKRPFDISLPMFNFQTNDKKNNP